MVIVFIVTLFIVAIVAPFPKQQNRRDRAGRQPDRSPPQLDDQCAGTPYTLPPGKLLPDRQPAYVASWIYVFGVTTLAALLIVLGTGAVLALRGPQWYHVSTLGHFVNGLHLWSVELFFFMVIHLWGKFWMAAWGTPVDDVVTGVMSFLGSIGTAFTPGTLIQSNFDSQWITTQAKDGLNSVDMGAWFNVLDLGQMLNPT